MSAHLKQVKAEFKKKKKKNENFDIVTNVESCFFRQLKEASIHPRILKQARQSGTLNLSNRGLAEVPDVVWSLNALTAEEVKALSLSMESADTDQWWEYVELKKLILASNALHAISPDIKNHHALTVVDLHDNCLTTLPPTFGELHNLTKLNVGRNRFGKLPECVFQLKNLHSLLAQHNQMKDLHDDVGNLSFLDELDISHNQLKELPPCIGFLSRVTVFNASNNEIESLPVEIGDMAALKRLEISHNKIPELPELIGMLGHLEQLYVQHNKLTSIPPLTGCITLKELHCGFNSITEMSSELIESLVCIKYLDFRDNKISEIPENISWLQSLEILHLSNNNLSSLPFSLGTLPHLQLLALDGNPMRSIRRDIILRGTAHLMKWLQSRMETTGSNSPPRPPGSAAPKRIGSPREIDKYTLKSTKALNFCNRDITEITDEVIDNAVEAEVTALDLSKNNLTEIPNRMQNLLPTLTEFNFGFNKLTALPFFMSEATRLNYLDIRNNRIQDLPSEISSLKNLREINLAFNMFQKLPSAIYELERLEIIIASENKIMDIDVTGLAKLSSLSTLDLRNNNISKVPPELGNLKQLRSLLLDGNLFRNPRPAVLAKGTQALLEFLCNQIVQE